MCTLTVEKHWARGQGCRKLVYSFKRVVRCLPHHGKGLGGVLMHELLEWREKTSGEETNSGDYHHHHHRHFIEP